MQLLNGIYTQAFNRRHRRVGHVLQGRYKSILVEKDSHLLELARYVVLNPVRAGMARSAHAWPWSSYRPTAGQGDVPDFLKVNWILSQFAPDRARATPAYRRFVAGGRDDDAWRDLRAGSLLGSDTFVEEMTPLLLEAPADPEVLRRERDAARPSLARLFAGLRDRATRDVLIYEAVHRYHYRLRDVGDFLGLHFSTVSVVASREAKRQSVQE